jgi:hypothetical protein
MSLIPFSDCTERTGFPLEKERFYGYSSGAKVTKAQAKLFLWRDRRTEKGGSKGAR